MCGFHKDGGSKVRHKGKGSNQRGHERCFSAECHHSQSETAQKEQRQKDGSERRGNKEGEERAAVREPH